MELVGKVTSASPVVGKIVAIPTYDSRIANIVGTVSRKE